MDNNPFSLMATGGDVVDGAPLADLPDGEHSDTGPSSANRVIRCPGSVAAIRAWRAMATSITPEPDATEDGDTPDAQARGTMLHDIIAHVIRQNVPFPQQLPKSLDNDPAGQYALRMCHRIYYDVWLDLLTAAAAFGSTVVTLVERRLPMVTSGARFGTVDVALVVPGVMAVLLDWKFGDRPVASPRSNWQGILYAHALVENFGVPSVKVRFVRPAAAAPWDDQEHLWDAQELASLAMTYRQAVDLAHQPDAPLCPGEHCTFCAVKDVCAARQACLLTLPTMATLPGFVASLTQQERRRLWDRLAIARGLVERMRTVLEEEALAGRCPIDGTTVEHKPGNRMWADPAQAAPVLEGLLAQAGKPASAAWVHELVTPAAAEKLVGKSAAVRGALDPLITRGPAQPKLVAR